MSDAPSIAVLMPVHNCERFVAEALCSVLRQTWTDFECLVLDDGSTDRTAAVCHAVAEGDPRVRVISKPNTGLVDTLNYGLMQVRAEVVARMDGDDVSLSNRFEDQFELLKLSRCAAVSCNYIQIDEYGNELEMGRAAHTASADADHIPPREPYLPHPFMMFWRDAVLAVGGYRHCVHSEDADLCWRLYDQACLWNIPEALGRYRIHLGSVSARSSANGRIQAVSAQLAAIDFRRRRNGESPLEFLLTPAEVAAAAGTMDGLVELYREILTPEEFDRLQLGGALRFLDFSRFRKYPVEVDDVVFARRVVGRSGWLLRDDQRDWVEWVVTEACRNLLT